MMSQLRQRATDNLVAALAADGERIIRECEQEKTYSHDTKNLYDSYGYGVYVGGKLTKKGFLSDSPQATEPRKWYGKEIHGREAIEAFLDAYKATNGIELVIAAAMPYAAVLENRGGGVQHKYKVISMSNDKLKAIAGKYPGSAVHAITNGSRQ